MIGFCLGFKKGRGASNNSSTIGIIFLVSYYVLFFTGVSFARKNLIPAYAVVFFPSLLSLLFGLRLFKKLDW